MKQAIAALLLATGAVLMAGGTSRALDIHRSQIEEVGRRVGKATAYLSLCPLRAAGDPLGEAVDWLVEHGIYREAGPSIAAEQNATIGAAMSMTLSDTCAKASAAFGTSGTEGVNWLVTRKGPFLDVRDLLVARDDMGLYDPVRKKIWVLANLVDAVRRCPDITVVANLDTYIAPFNVDDVYTGWLRNTFFTEQIRVELAIERGERSDQSICDGYLYSFGPQGADVPRMIGRR